MRAVGRVVLLEAPSKPLGGYTAFIARSGTGRTYVGDIQNGRVVRFGPDGRPEIEFGQPGAGPGEFGAPGVVALIGADTVLAVGDVTRRDLSLFDSRTGQFLRRVRLPSQDIGTEWSVIGDTAVFALFGSQPLVGLFLPQSDGVQALGTTPVELLAAPEVYVRYGRPNLVVTADGFLAHLPTEGGLRVLDRSGAITSWVPLPATRRRGEPSNLVDVARSALKRKDFQPRGSLAAGVHVTSTGQIMVAMVDVDFVALPTGGRFANPRLYVSLLQPDLSQACVDGEVPMKSDAPLIPSFRNDTMFVLTREVTDGNSVVSAVTGYTVDDSSCEWIPTGRR